MRRNYYRLNKAFRLMREEGLLAERNFWCCQTCAGYHMTNDAVRAVDRGETVTGCCFYHSQDQEELTETGKCYLAYGDMDSTEKGKIGLPTEEVGKIVAACLAKAGVPYEWDGNPNSRIKVYVP